MAIKSGGLIVVVGFLLMYIGTYIPTTWFHHLLLGTGFLVVLLGAFIILEGTN